jgi:hypothetical protein
MRELSLMRLEQKVSRDLVDRNGKTVVMLWLLVVQIVWGALGVQYRIGAISV